MWNRKRTETIVVLLLRSQMSIFRESSGKITSYPFDSKLVQDLEVKDEAGFAKGLTLFFQQQKLTNASAILLLDNSIYFSKKMTDNEKSELTQKPKTQEAEAPNSKDTKELPDAELENQKRLFVQSVPFANVFSTMLTIDKEKILIALNRDFYEPVVKALTEREIKVIAIFPMIVVSHLFKSNGFTAQTAGLLLTTIDKYHAQNFLKSTIKKDEMMGSVTALPQDDSARKRLLAMAVVFVVLIGILVAVIYWSRQRDAVAVPQTSPPVVTEPVATPTSSSSPTALVQASSAASLSDLLTASDSASPNFNQLSVHVFNASDDSQAPDILVQQLKDVGFTNVTEGRAQATLTGSVRVSVLATIPLELREALSAQMDQWGYQTNFQEVATQENEIEITLTIL